MKEIGVGILWLCGLWWVGGVVGWPIDVFLLVALLAATWRDEWAGFVLAGAAGWWGESVIAAPAGSLLGPAWLGFGVLRYSTRQLALHTAGLRFTMVGVAAAVAVSGKWLVYHRTMDGMPVGSLLWQIWWLAVAWMLCERMFVRTTMGETPRSARLSGTPQHA